MKVNFFIRKLSQYARMQAKMTFAKLRAHNGLVKVNTKNGYPIYVNINDMGVGRQLIVNRKRETLATDFYDQHLEDGMTVLECGANIGYYTLLTLVKRPNCRAICFEPIKENVELLTKNLALNNVTDRANVYPYACGDKEGEATIYMSQMSNAGTLVGTHSRVIAERKVKVIKIDDSLNKEKKVDYVRMDVEGYEWHIIKGMLGLLNVQQPKKLFIEIHPVQLKKLGTSINEFFELLSNQKYKFTLAIYEGAAIIMPRENQVFTDLKAYQENPNYETRSAQVFFDLEEKKWEG